MRLRVLVICVLAALGMVRAAVAQEQAWVQLEAQPSLTEAEDRARSLAAEFPGFVYNKASWLHEQALLAHARDAQA